MAASGGRGSVVRTSEDSRRQAGILLERRRSDLGLSNRAEFARSTGLTYRFTTELEHGRQVNFLVGRLQRVARAYSVTYESLVAVMTGEAAALTPAPGPAPAVVLRPVPPGGAWLPPVSADRIAAAAPYADRIWQRLRNLAAGGVTEPSGAQVFGAGTADARTWDDLAPRLEERERVWMLAELQVRESGPARRRPGGPAAAPRSARHELALTAFDVRDITRAAPRVTVRRVPPSVPRRGSGPGRVNVRTAACRRSRRFRVGGDSRGGDGGRRPVRGSGDGPGGGGTRRCRRGPGDRGRDA